MPTSIEYIIIYVLGTLLVLLILWVLRLELKLRNILKGGDGKSLEQSIIASKRDIEQLESFRKSIESYLQNVEKRLKQSIQGIETIRFNPFKGEGVGGNQSFATAFLNEDGNGVILSSLYARERVSIFSKPIKKYASEFELTEEEKKAMEGARNSVSHKS